MINALDIETYVEEKTNYLIPYCICYSINGIMYSHYKDSDNNVILDFLESVILNYEGNSIEFYVHNINFDGFVLLDGLTSIKIKFEHFSVKTNMYKLRIEYSGKVINFRCSYKIIPLPLRKIGEIEGYSKSFFPHKFVKKENLNYCGKIPDIKYWDSSIDLNDLLNIDNQNTWDLKKECIKYCTIDVNIVILSMEKISKVIAEEDKNLLNKSFSTPSLAFNLFFKKYNNFKIIKKLPRKEEIYVRPSFLGGRTEVFGNLRENEFIKYFDHSQMYGTCMQSLFPLGKYSYETPNNFDKLGFYDIIFESKNNEIPLLGVRLDNKLLFPNGVFRGRYWVEEIRRHIKEGGKIHEIKHALVYEQSEYVFDNFIKTFKEIRKKGGYYNTFGKLMMNSLYGSLALSSEETHTITTQSEEEFNKILNNFSVINFYSINSYYIIIIEVDSKFRELFKMNDELTRRNIIYPSIITSKGRIKIHETISEVIADGGRPLYCDTDSIFAAYSKEDRREYFGKVKWLKFYSDGVFILPKTYGLRDESGIETILMKGFSNSGLSLKKLKEVFYNEGEIVINDQDILYKKNFKIESRVIEKKLNTNYPSKREWNNDKTSTTPLILTNVYK